MPTTPPRMPPAPLATARREPGRRPRAVAGVVGVAVALVLGGCADGGTPAPGGTATSGSATASGTASPMTLERTGGVAGYADRLGVAGDGSVTGTTRSGPVDCTVPAQTVQTLATAPAPSVPPAAGTDRMKVLLERSSGRANLGEAQGADPLSTTARELLDDVQLPPEQRTVCR